MRKTLVKTIALAIVIALCFAVTSFADYSDKMAGLIKEADTVVIETGASNTAESVIGTIISAARIIGICFAVVMLLTIAMKYMTAAAGDKADIKKSAVAYVVGAVVLFGATNIIASLVEFTNNALGSA